MPFFAGLVVAACGLAVVGLAGWVLRLSPSAGMVWMHAVSIPLPVAFGTFIIVLPSGSWGQPVGLLVLTFAFAEIVLLIFAARSAPRALLWRGKTFERARERINEALRGANRPAIEDSPGRWQLDNGRLSLDPRRNVIGRWTTRVDVADHAERRALTRSLQDAATPSARMKTAMVGYALAGIACGVAGVLLALS